MYNNYNQQRRAAITILLVCFISLTSMAYLFYTTHSMKSEQEWQYYQLDKKIRDLQNSLDNGMQEMSSSYNKKLKEVDSLILTTHEDYTRKTRTMLESAERAEEAREEIEAIRQELRNSDSATISKVISEAVKASVSIIADGTQGSGAVLSRDGYIVTNNHVIKNANSVTIIDYDGRVSPAAVVAADEMRDLAILKSPKEYSDYVNLGNSDEVKIGETVIAIGSPKGLDFTVTKGIVSSESRVFSEDEGSFIQIDVPVDLGSSGGPLINTKGSLIGINTFKIRGTQGLGFAIPSNDVKKIFEAASNP